MAKVDGQTVKVGDYVSFKCDIEQGGTIYKIEGDRLLLQNAKSICEGKGVGACYFLNGLDCGWFNYLK